MADIKDYQKKVKDSEQQKKRLLPFKNFNFLTPLYKKAQESRFAEVIRRSTENKKEREYWNRYLKIVKNSFTTDNVHRKFSVSHVEELGIPWDILFIYGKKDSGKTWAVASYIRRLLEEDPDAQIVFIRNSKEENKGFQNTINSSSHWCLTTTQDYIYKREEYEKKGSKAKPCGYFAYASGMGFTRWQGGDYENVKFWWWDECNSVAGGLTQDVFQKLVVFLSSIIRDKSGVRGVKGIMTGNLLEKSNIFLDRLGVSAKTNLKIIDNYKDNNPKKELLSKMLYLNTGELFKGIEEQKGLATQFLSIDEFQGLLTNRPELNTGKAQYEERDLRNLRSLKAFVYRHKEDTNDTSTAKKIIDYILYIYSVPGSRRTVLWIDEFKTFNIKPGFTRVYCNDSIVANNYPMTIPIPEKEDFGEMFIEPLENYLFTGEVWYGWNGTQEVFEKTWPTLRSHYIKEDNDSI